MVLITGGTGSLGRELTKKILPLAKEVRIFSRDEDRQVAMRRKFLTCRYILGDIKDYFSIRDAVRNVDVVIHTAAFKHIDLGEEQPTECVEINVVGSLNVIRASKEEGVGMVVGISTDKVTHPQSVYGCSKHIMEKLFAEAGRSGAKTKFIVCRFGNLIGSAGSVIPHWIKLAEQGKDLMVTNRSMTRIFISLPDAANLILEAIQQEKPFVFKQTKAAKMWRVAEIIADGRVKVVEGKPRPGEKIHEDLIADYESYNGGKPFGSQNAELMTDTEIRGMVEMAKISNGQKVEVS